MLGIGYAHAHAHVPGPQPSTMRAKSDLHDGMHDGASALTQWQADTDSLHTFGAAAPHARAYGHAGSGVQGFTAGPAAPCMHASGCHDALEASSMPRVSSPFLAHMHAARAAPGASSSPHGTGSDGEAGRSDANTMVPLRQLHSMFAPFTADFGADQANGNSAPPTEWRRVNVNGVSRRWCCFWVVRTNALTDAWPEVVVRAGELELCHAACTRAA